jgi:hypothetical protein
MSFGEVDRSHLPRQALEGAALEVFEEVHTLQKLHGFHHYSPSSLSMSFQRQRMQRRKVAKSLEQRLEAAITLLFGGLGIGSSWAYPKMHRFGSTSSP